MLIPLLARPLHLVLDGPVRFAAARLYAWAAGIVFPQANEPNRNWYDVSATFASAQPSFENALRYGAWGDVPRTFDEALLRAMNERRAAPDTLGTVRTFVSRRGEAEAPEAWQTVTERPRSRRQVERLARALTHRSPQQLVRLARFHYVRDTLWARPDSRLNDVALDAGYADQAHLSREFRRFSGRTPTQFKRDVANLQDAARNGGYNPVP